MPNQDDRAGDKVRLAAAVATIANDGASAAEKNAALQVVDEIHAKWGGKP